MPARQTRRHRSLGRTAAAMARTRAPGPTRAAEAVAVRTVAPKRLTAPARMARTEAILPAARLANGEFRNGARGRRLPFSRQRRAYKRPMYGSLVVLAILLVALTRVLPLSDAIVFRREIGLDFRIVCMLVALDGSAVDLR